MGCFAFQYTVWRAVYVDQSLEALDDHWAVNKCAA